MAATRKVVTMLAVDTQSLYAAAQETASIGNKGTGKSEVLLTSDKAVATFIGVRWDGDKVRGVRMELSDGSFKQAGGYDDTRYTLTQYSLRAGRNAGHRTAQRLRVWLWKFAPNRVRNVPEGEAVRGGSGRL